MRKVLHVEDNDADSLIVGSVLKSDDWEVVRVRTVAEATLHLSFQELEFIVLDMKLPNGHGRQVIQNLRDIRDDVPIVVITGTPPDDRPKAVWPVVAVLGKPLDSVEVIEEVYAAVKTATAIRQIRDGATALRRLSKGI